MAGQKSKSELEIEAQLKSLDPASFRYQVLASAKDFKAIWVQMGDFLTKVREQSLYKEWGYKSFEIYCRKEVRIRQDTANKLTRSFSFVRDNEPEALAARGDQELPPLDVVDLLARARERTVVPEEELNTIREEVFHGEKEPTRQRLMKRFREVDPEAFRAKKPDEVILQEGDPDMRKAVLVAERLLSLLEPGPSISSAAKLSMQTIVQELTALLESATPAEEPVQKVA
ncbi:MAG: hypothetical protein VX699_13915 [Myxococcota bacterium]|nr:hypothetical protein [Myxococcota bacterium]